MNLARPVRWFAQLPGGRGYVRVERITRPSRGDVESTCLVRVLTPAGTPAPGVPVARVAARLLVRD